MEKDTSKILEELKNCSSFKNFYKENNDTIIDSTLSNELSKLLNEKALKKSTVIKKAELSETYAYEIFSGVKHPIRNKVLCIAFGMELNLEETQRLLKLSSYPQLYVKNPFDCIIIYGICNNYSVVKVNSLLYEYGFETLG